MDKEIVIKPKFDLKMLFQANLYLLLKKPLILIVGAFYILFFSSLIFLLILGENDFVEELASELTNSALFYFLLLAPLFYLSLIYYSSRKQLSGNYRLNENFEFIFNNEYFQEKGETFDLKHFWDKLLKVKEKKSYFLIYQNKNRANIIPKNGFDQLKLKDFRNLIKSINIKSELN